MNNNDQQGDDEDDNFQMEELIPRNYQVEMLRAVIAKNSIIYLPTGAGKTFISFMAMKHYYSQIEIPLSAGGKRIVFAAPKVAIVTQQFNVLKRQTQFSVGMFNGNMNVDNWDKATWESQISLHQVLVMGSQILLDILDKGFLKMSHICLLVLDECHHATESHNMKLIMENHYLANQSNMPRILGLTAALVKKNLPKHKLHDEVLRLEKNLCSKIVRHYNDEDLRGLYANPKIQVLPVEGLDPLKESGLAVVIGVLNDAQLLKSLKTMGSQTSKGGHGQFSALGTLVTKKNAVANDCSKTVLDIEHHLQDLGLFGGKLAITYHIARFKVLKFTVSVNSIECKILEKMLDHLNDVSNVVDQILAEAHDDIHRMVRFSAKKVHGLFDILRNGLKSKNGETDMCGIVFVERRVTAVVLFHILKIAMGADKTLSAIRPDFALGGSGSQSFGTREYAMKNNKMKKSIDRFNAGITNLVFSTDVLEEGIDVPRCNIVVRFDHIKTMCSFIQSKGRARDQTANFHILDVDGEFRKKQLSYLEMEKLLKHIQTKDDNADAQNEAKKIPPFKTAVGSLATVDNSIKMIYRYCNSFSSGRFCSAEPDWYYEDKSDQGPYIFSVVLPASSPYKKPITGTEMESMKEAKGVCALEAVKLLYLIGELDEYLRPKGKSDQNNEMNNKELFKHWKKSEEGDEGLAGAGTRNRKREHSIKFPDCLTNAAPKPHVQTYVHVLHLTPNFMKTEAADSRRAFLFDLMKNADEEFALLSSKPWPQLCAFPVYTNFGEIRAEIESNCFTVELDEDDIKKIQAFHLFLFEKVLSIKHDFLQANFDSGYSNFLLAPLKFPEQKDASNFVSFINEHKQTGIEESLIGKVVNPTHRPAGLFDKANFNYIVTKVRMDLNPMSSFPEGKFKNFAEFYKQKYQKEVTNFSQALIEVRPISDKLCMLKQGRDNSLSKKSHREGEIFIPELCVVAPINNVLSTHLWLKATTLPTVLVRMGRLMIAEELRKEVNSSMKIGAVQVPKGFTWEPMQITNFGDKYESYKTDSAAEFGKKGLKRLTIQSRSSKLKNSDPSPWYPEEEPKDLDYNLLTLTDEDIINYSRFAMKKLENSFTLDSQNISYKQRDMSIKVKPIDLLAKTRADIGPQQHALYTALTTTTANDAVDMERLETLGDSFLKFASSLYLFSTYDFAEGKLTELKGKIVGNKNLFYCAMNKNIGCVLNSTRFSPRQEWKAPNYEVPKSLLQELSTRNLSPSVLKNVVKLDNDNWLIEECPNKEEVHMHSLVDKQIISDKCVSDCVEAVLGAYVQSCGPIAAASILAWFEILPPEIIEIMTSPSPSCINIDELAAMQNSISESVNKHLHRVDKIESVLGYKFKDRALLLQALTHPSCMTNRLTNCNQRLEFLGDAVLDFLITCYIYEQCGNLSPGAVTDLRSALVNNVVFGSLAVRFGLHSHLLQNSPSLFQAIGTFVEHQQNNDHNITEEYLLAMNEDSCISVASYVEVPKVLGDIWESLAGAVFLDSGKDLASTWDVFYPLMKKEIDAFSVNVPIQPARMLYELVGKDNTSFQAVEKKEGGCRDVVLKLTVKHPRGTITCYGQGRNRQQAKIASAKYALKKIDEI